MARGNMNHLLKQRMAATQQASELQVSNDAYQKIFCEAPPARSSSICEVPLDRLVPFFTADIGFKPYPPSKLKAFAEQISEEGLMVRIIVIATSTNLIQRQELSIIERGKAYRALLDAKNRNGQRNAAVQEQTFGENRQRSADTDNHSTFGENRQRYNAAKQSN